MAAPAILVRARVGPDHRPAAPRLAAIAVIVVAILLAVAPAHADSSDVQGPVPTTPLDDPDRQGVAIDLGSVSVDDLLAPGGSYLLPAVRVRNPGTVETSYEMALRPGGEGLEPGAAWGRFSPATFTLASGDEQLVTVELVLPVGAPHGTYTGLIAAQIMTVDSGTGVSGARVGAAAATRLEFRVVASSWLAGLMTALRRWLAETSPWSGVAAGTALAAFALWMLSRRFHLRLERVPRRPTSHRAAPH